MKILARVLLCGALLSVAACSGNSEHDLIGRAKSSLDLGKYQDAVIDAKNALQKNQNSGQARYILGAALFLAGDFVASEFELRKALELKYSPDQVVPILAKALLAQQKAKKLTEEFGAMTLGDRDASLAFRTSLALAYGRLESRKKANDLIEAVLSDDSEYAPAMLVKARFLAGEKKFQVAEVIVDKVLAKAPKDIDALLLKGDLRLLGAGDFKAASKLYEEVLSLRPREMAAHNALMAIFFHQKDIVRAKEHLAELNKFASKNPQVLFYQAQISLLSGDVLGARKVVTELLRLSPDNLKLLEFAGGLELQAGGLTLAENHFSRALSLDPAQSVTRRLLARTYLRSGQPAKALSTLKVLVDRSPPDAEALGLAAEAYMQQDDNGTAWDFLQHAAVAKAGDPGIMTAMAVIRLVRGEQDVALRDLQAIAFSDQGVQADRALITARMDRKEWKQALEAVDNYQRKMPNSPVSYEIRGRIQEQAGDATSARKNFELALVKDKVYFPAVAGLTRLDILERKFSAAKARLTDFLKLNPRTPDAQLALIDLKARDGASLDSVTTMLSDAISLNPDNAKLRLALISNYWLKRNFPRALVAAQEAVAVIPNNFFILDALGLSQMRVGEPNQAVLTFNRMTSIRADATLPYMRLADVYLLKNQSELAKQSYKKVLGIDSKNIDAQFGLIVLAMRDGKSKEAMAIARTVQGQRPGEAIGYMLEGDINRELKLYPQAIAAYSLGQSKSGVGRLPMKIYETYKASKRSGDAEQFASAWLSSRPQDVDFMFYLGDQALMNKSFDEAFARYSEVLRIEPKNSNAMNNIAWLMVRLGRPHAAAMAASAVELAPGNPAFLDTYATVLAAEGQLAKALEIQRSAVTLSPNNAKFQLNEAKIQLRLGEKAAAKALLSRLSLLGDRFPQQVEVQQLLKSLAD